MGELVEPAALRQAISLRENFIAYGTEGAKGRGELFRQLSLGLILSIRPRHFLGLKNQLEC